MTTSSFSTAFIGPGYVTNVTAPYARLGGQGMLVGSLFGVAAKDLALSEVGPMNLTGKYTLAKTSAQAYTVGQRVAWDDTNKRLDSTLTVGPVVGIVTDVAANPSSTATVVLFGASGSAVVPQAAIVTLTDSTGGSGTHDDTLADGLTSVAPAAFTAPIAGAVTVTSNAATDLSSIVAPAVENLRGVVATLVTDATVCNQNVSDLGQKVIQILAALQAAGITV